MASVLLSSQKVNNNNNNNDKKKINIWVLGPFQEYCTYIEPIVNQSG